MVKDIIVIADLGAAGNLVRNLLLLSNQTDWPLLSDRLGTILQQYRPADDLSQWLDTEHRLRYWDKFYGVDLSDNINLLAFQQRNTKSSPVVYINHSALYQIDVFRLIKQQALTIYVAPTTEFGLRWQVRSYCEKKTAEKLHNFTFETDIDAQREHYCLTHGADSYYKLNVLNFKEIIKHRQQEFGIPDISLELLLTGNANVVTDTLYKCLGIKIDVEFAQQVLDKWRQCHWPIAETNNWKYYD